MLAIAGLVLAIVFIAVPALQRNSRNTQRRSDLANFRAQFDTWVGNNGGKIPSTVAHFNSIVGSTGWGHYNGNDDEPEIDGAFPTSTTATTEDTPHEELYVFGKDVGPVTGADLPNRNSIHVWLERSCIDGGILSAGNDEDTNSGTDKYAAADLVDSTARTVSFVYQVEGEDNARCEDNI